MTSGWVTNPGTWTRDEESLAQASNVDLSAPGVIAKRRGFSNNTLNSYSGSVYAALSSPALERDIGVGALLLAVGDPTGGSLGFRVGTRASTFAAITGSFASEATARPKLTTGPDGNDIVTTWVTGGDCGPVVPDYVALTGRYLGVPRGMGLDRLNSATDGVTGFLPVSSCCRYAVTFSLGDPTVNGTQQGAPGMTTVFTNTAGTAVNVKVRALLPKMYGTTNTALPADTYWIQIWRSVTQATAAGEPPSELALVYQQILSAADIAAGYVQVIDIVPDVARGASLYTNTLTGEDGLGGRGFINSNEPPPAAKDVASFADCVWFGSLQDFPSQEVQLIAVGGTGLVAADTFSAGGVTYTCVAGAPGADQFQLSSGGTASENQRETALNLVDAINRSASNTTCWAFYTAGIAGQPGRIRLIARTMSSSLAASTSRAAAFIIGTEDANNPTKNGVAFSKPLQGHAFPFVNRFELGRGDAEVMRIMPYRDSLYVFKADGLWRITGTDWRDFTASAFDETFRLLARETVVALDDGLYAWGVGGLARISDGGVEYLDAPIRNQVVSTQAAVTTTTMESFAFAVPMPRDGVVVFFFPVFDAGHNSTDPDNVVPCVNAFVWFARTKTWALWVTQGDGLIIGYTCGSANVTDALLSLGVWQAATSSGAWVHNERRTYTSADFSDPDMRDPETPLMTARAIPMSLSWRPVSGPALGSAQWQRVRVDLAPADATRDYPASTLTVETIGDAGNPLLSASVSIGSTGGDFVPTTAVAPVHQTSSRSHALQVQVFHGTLNAGVWLVSTSVDYRPFSTKAIR